MSISGQTIQYHYNGDDLFTSIHMTASGAGSPPTRPPTCNNGALSAAASRPARAPPRRATTRPPATVPAPPAKSAARPPSSGRHARAEPVDGIAGTCISTSSCAAKGGHHSTPGYCPGPSSEECCTPNSSPPPPPPSGPSCTVEGNEGVCISTSQCSGMWPATFDGPASPWSSEGESAAPFSICSRRRQGRHCATRPESGLHRHSTAGLCPGPANEECCIP